MSSNKETDTMARWHTYSEMGGSADFETFYAHSVKNQESEIMARWHTYSEMGGSADFEVFYAHSVKNQELLVKVARGKALLTRSA